MLRVIGESVKSLLPLVVYFVEIHFELDKFGALGDVLRLNHSPIVHTAAVSIVYAAAMDPVVVSVHPVELGWQSRRVPPVRYG